LRLRLFSFGGYRLALAALALVVFGAVEWPPFSETENFPAFSSAFLKQGNSFEWAYSATTGRFHFFFRIVKLASLFCVWSPVHRIALMNMQRMQLGYLSVLSG